MAILHKKAFHSQKAAVINHIGNMMLTKKDINEMFRRFAEKKADPEIELDYTSPYTLLIAVVLSAQATDKGVNRATPNLFAIASTPQQMVDLGEENLREYIRSLGLFNSKARNIIALSQMLLDEFNGEVPATLKELEKLPGVGRKSANVILNSVFKIPTIAVDTHVFRVSNRIGFCTAKTPRQTEDALERLVPKEWKPRAHYWLVLHGRYTCKARKPDCPNCIIRDICTFNAKK